MPVASAPSDRADERARLLLRLRSVAAAAERHGKRHPQDLDWCAVLVAMIIAGTRAVSEAHDAERSSAPWTRANS